MKKHNLNIDDELNYLIQGSKVKSREDFTESVLNNLPGETGRIVKNSFNISLLLIVILINVFSILSYYKVEESKISNEIRMEKIKPIVTVFELDDK